MTTYTDNYGHQIAYDEETVKKVIQEAEKDLAKRKIPPDTMNLCLSPHEYKECKKAQGNGVPFVAKHKKGYVKISFWSAS